MYHSLHYTQLKVVYVKLYRHITSAIHTRNYRPYVTGYLSVAHDQGM